MTASGRSAWILVLAVGIALAGGVVWVLGLDRAKVAGGTPDERIASICRLADERPWGAAGAIAAAAGDPHPAVRQAVMVALSKFVDDAAYRPAVEAGVADEDATVRAAAAATLGLYADGPAVDRLGALLKGDPSERGRLAATRGLARTRRPRAIVLLVKAMETNESPNVRYRAMEVLMAHLGLSFDVSPDPRDPVVWSRAVRAVRLFPAVRAAYRAAGGESD